MPIQLDDMWTAIALGLFFLAFGGDFLVKSSAEIAARLGVSPLLIGLTLVGFGTSTPELVTSIQAAMIDSGGIAIGNIVGSNIANILLILGLSALLMPLAASAGAIYRDGFFVVLAAVLLAWVSLKGTFGLEVGVAFLGILAVYVLAAWTFERANPDSTAAVSVDEGVGLFWPVVIALTAIGLLIFGASLLVDGSVKLARTLDLSETFIGLTLVAVGTSLPELFTSVTAAIRRQSDIAIGNILGSNIYNILGIGGVVSIIHPVQAPAQIANFDNFMMITVSLLLLVWLILARGIGRIGGLLFLALYFLYIFHIHPGLGKDEAQLKAVFSVPAEWLKGLGR